MNGGFAPKRRSARLSAEGNENQDEQPPSKKARVTEEPAVKKRGRKKGEFGAWRESVEGWDADM